MSLGLVSYDSSSDESDSGEEHQTLKPNESYKENSQVKGPFVDDDLPKHFKSSTSGRDTKPHGGLFSTLPSPRHVEKHGNSEADSDVRESKLSIPPTTKTDSSIKIVAPSLPDPDSDSDEEPQAKKIKGGKKISSLFAMLPEPKHAALKQTNRILIPHTLTKKKPDQPPDSLKTHQPGTSASRVPATRALETDATNDADDEESNNFFSLGNDKGDKPSAASNKKIQNDKSVNTQPFVQKYSHERKQERQIPVPQEQIKPSSTQAGPKNVALQEAPTTTPSSKLVSPSIGQREATVEAPPSASQGKSKLLKSVQPDMNEQPLNFSNKRTPYGYQSQSYANHSYTLQDGVSNQQDYGTYQGVADYSGYHQQGYPMYHEQYTDEGGHSGGRSSTISSAVIQDKNFQRMVGKGNFDPNELNIIDVNADDHISTVSTEEWMLKSLTEEKQAREKLNKEELPTSQQKRKHQITYLARQAKERELELKNSWAQNRMTRKQTQAKYGF